MEKNWKIGINTFYQSISRFLVIIASVLTTAILTRILGVSGYGNYVFLTSFLLVFVGLSDLGITSVAIREASIDKPRSSKIFGSVFWCRLIVSLLLVFVLNILIVNLPQFSDTRNEVAVGSLVILFLVIRTTVEAVFRSVLRMDWSASLELIASFLFFFLLLFYYFFKIELTLLSLVIFWVLSALISGLFGFLISFRFLSWDFKLDKKLSLKLIREALPLGLYLLIYAVYDKGIDSFMIKTFLNSEAVGYYGLAYKVHGNLILLAAFLANSLFPVLSSLPLGSLELSKLYKKAFSFLLFTAFFIMAAVLLFSPFIVTFLAGNQYFASILVLRILAGATFFSFLNHLTGFFLIAKSKQSVLLKFSLLAFFVNLMLNLLLIPIWGINAAALVTILTEALIFLLTYIYISKEFNLRLNIQDLHECFLLMLKDKLHYFNK